MIGNVFDLQHLIIREFAQRWHHHLKSHFCIYKQSIIKPVVIHINSPIAALRNPGRQACTKRHTQQFIFVSSAPPILVLPQPWCLPLDLLLTLPSPPPLRPLVSDDDQGLWVSHREPVTPSSAGSGCRSPTRRARSARCCPWPPPACCTAASRAACSGRPGLCLGVAPVAMAPPLALKCPR